MPMRGKGTEISQVALMKRWRSLFLGRRRCCSRLSDHSGSVKAGCLALYVGEERRRFVIPTRFLNLPVFAPLLDASAEEFGFRPDGPLEIPCDAEFFAWVVGVLDKDGDKTYKDVSLDGFLKMYADLGVYSSSSSSSFEFDFCTPLLCEKATV